MVRIPCACHVKRNPSNDACLPTFWQRPQNIAPATIFTTCPIPCTCHVNSRFWPSQLKISLRLPCKMKFMSENIHEHTVKRCLRNCALRGANFARACAIEINIESQNGITAQTKPAVQSEHLNEHPALTLTVRTPQCNTLFGGKNIKKLNHGWPESEKSKRCRRKVCRCKIVDVEVLTKIREDVRRSTAALRKTFRGMNVELELLEL